MKEPGNLLDTQGAFSSSRKMRLTRRRAIVSWQVSSMREDTMVTIAPPSTARQDLQNALVSLENRRRINRMGRVLRMASDQASASIGEER